MNIETDYIKGSLGCKYCHGVIEFKLGVEMSEGTTISFPETPIVYHDACAQAAYVRHPTILKFDPRIHTPPA